MSAQKPSIADSWTGAGVESESRVAVLRIRSLSAASESFLRFIVRSHLWVAGSVSALALSVARELSIELGHSAVWLIFLSTLMIYHTDHLRDGRSHRGFSFSFHFTWLSVASILAIPALLSVEGRTRWLVCTGGAICLLYGSRFPGGRRLKDVPGIKGVWVSGAVSLATVSVPCLQVGQSLFSPGPLSMLLAFFVLAWINVQFFDVNDLDSDRSRGVETLPVVFGVQKTRWTMAMVGLVAVIYGAIFMRDLSNTFLCGWAMAQGVIVFASWFQPMKSRCLRAQLAGDGALFLPWLFVEVLR